MSLIVQWLFVLTYGSAALAVAWAPIAVPVWAARRVLRHRRAAGGMRRELLWATRADDGDRAAVVFVLREAYAGGRLALPELERRVQTALVAVTAVDLGALVADLPEASLWVGTRT